MLSDIGLGRLDGFLDGGMHLGHICQLCLVPEHLCLALFIEDIAIVVDGRINIIARGV